MKETSKEEEPGEEDQEDVTTMMIKATWLDIFLIQAGHSALIVELMGTQLNTAQK
jgi:hypothetical protein